jgi:hypothetical protein
MEPQVWSVQTTKKTTFTSSLGLELIADQWILMEGSSEVFIRRVPKLHLHTQLFKQQKDEME